MKFKVFILVLFTMAFIENPPILSNARTFGERTKVNPIVLPLLDSVNTVANELKEVKKENLRYLELLKRQQEELLKQQ